MQLSVDVSDTPDNDKFLPRQMTVQLLAILVRALPTSTPKNNNTKFIEAFRHQNLFNPLTYAIFWREDIAAAIDNYTNDLDGVDQYSRAPLLTALANEDFTTAMKLLDKGAKIFLEDKLVLELALFSIIQRDANNAAKILAAASPEAQAWVGEYLDYLHSYAAKTPAKNTRDIIDPPLRHFGQILETTAYFNGIPSYYGFLSPSLFVLQKHLTEYASHEPFAKIKQAFDFTIAACDYHGNLPQNANAAQTLYEQIKNNFKTNNKEAVVLFGGWAGNAVAMAFINNTLVFSNLGTASDLQHGSTIYKISKPEAISLEFVDSFIRGLGTAANPADILTAIGEFVDQTPVFQLKQELKPIDNCIFVNPRILIEGLLLVLSAYSSETKIDEQNLAKIAQKCSTTYQEYLNSLYKIATDDLVKLMRNSDILDNLRLECCNVALEYINQHFQDEGAITRCIELKNALEFVGLKDYYLRQISGDAREAILQQMISEQESTAIKVIDLEYELFGKKIDHNPPNISAPTPTTNNPET